MSNFSKVIVGWSSLEDEGPLEFAARCATIEALVRQFFPRCSGFVRVPGCGSGDIGDTGYACESLLVASVNYFDPIWDIDDGTTFLDALAEIGWDDSPGADRVEILWRDENDESYRKVSLPATDGEETAPRPS